MAAVLNVTSSAIKQTRVQTLKFIQQNTRLKQSAIVVTRRVTLKEQCPHYVTSRECDFCQEHRQIKADCESLKRK